LILEAASVFVKNGYKPVPRTSAAFEATISGMKVEALEYRTLR
jgi:hypothetical protein